MSQLIPKKEPPHLTGGFPKLTESLRCGAKPHVSYNKRKIPHGGVRMIRKKALIDYLTITMDSREVCLDMLPPTEWLSYAGKFYAQSYRAFGDAIVMLNETGHPQGSFVSFGGQALAEWYANGQIGDLIWLGQRARNVTRLDYAIDIIAESEQMRPVPEVFYASHKAGGCISRVRESELIESNHVGKDGKIWNGKTCYIGGRKSERRLRIYDKAAELQVDQVFWTRFELQNRGRQAQVAFDNCVSNGVFASAFDGITRLCSFGIFFEYILSPEGQDVGGTGEFLRAGRKKTRLEKYLDQTRRTLKAKSRSSDQNYDTIVRWMHDLFDGIIKEA